MVTTRDRQILRDLASQVAEIAALPAQQEKAALWKANNALRPQRPMVMIDQIPWHEMNVNGELDLECDDAWCQGVECQLRRSLYRWRHMPADFVVEPFVDIPKVIRNSGFGIGLDEDLAILDPQNDVVGHAYHDQVATEDDLEKIRTPEVELDVFATAELEDKARHVFDGTLEVRMQGAYPWISAWDLISMWRSPEACLWDVIDRPDFSHAVVARLMKAAHAMLDQMEEKGLLGQRLSWVHCTGAFTDELPAEGFQPDSPRAMDLWTFGMAQIFSSVSPAMHDEFEIEHMIPWYRRWGMVYYGCCEPLDDRIDIVRRLPHVRKISQSPWVQVRRGAEAIGRDFVFSRKPPPALLAVDSFSLEDVRRDLQETIQACRDNGCALEIILKDISTVRYEPQRLWEWERAAMELVQA